MIHINFNMDN